jgi:serine/threonine protein kinase
MSTRRTPCLVIEFLPNGSVGDFFKTSPQKAIKENIILTAGHIKNIAKQLLTGIHFMHTNFFIHRDLKPDNMMIGSDGKLKLIDFGMAKNFGEEV